jgi:CheY-like chemotaxis protein
MGGEIGVRSELGQGSEFWCRCRFEKASTEQGKHYVVSEELAGQRVLVVTERPMTATLVRELLQTFGLDAEACRHRCDVLPMISAAAAAGKPFAIAIFDEDLAESPSAPSLEQIRPSARAAGCRILRLCHHGDIPGDKSEDHLVFKPLRQSSLFDAVMTLLAPSATAERALRAKGPTKTPAPAPKISSARILVAEDNDINQVVTRTILSKAGYACDIVANGKEALEALKQKEYDIVLMDCQMPEMDGLEAARAYREFEKESPAAASRPTLPIIALTANALRGDRELCLDAGMTDYLSKPITPPRLIEKIEHWLADLAKSS